MCLGRLLLLRWRCQLFGINKFPLRSCCLCGVCSVIGCQRRIISFAVGWLLLIPGCVLLIVILSKLPIICFCIVLRLARCGSAFWGGWVSQWPFLLVWLTILISSLGMMEPWRIVVLVCRLSGTQLRGKFGKKEITGYLMASKAQLFRWLIKIKSLTFMWLKEKYPMLPFNLHAWWLSPFSIWA